MDSSLSVLSAPKEHSQYFIRHPVPIHKICYRSCDVIEAAAIGGHGNCLRMLIERSFGISYSISSRNFVPISVDDNHLNLLWDSCLLAVCFGRDNTAAILLGLIGSIFTSARYVHVNWPPDETLQNLFVDCCRGKMASSLRWLLDIFDPSVSVIREAFSSSSANAYVDICKVIIDYLTRKAALTTGIVLDKRLISDKVFWVLMNALVGRRHSTKLEAHATAAMVVESEMDLVPSSREESNFIATRQPLPSDVRKVVVLRSKGRLRLFRGSSS